MSLPIPPRESDSLPILKDTALVAGVGYWKLRPPNYYAIVMVKGTYRIVPGEAAVPVEEPQYLHIEQPFEDSEETLRYGTESAYFKPRADVTVVGHAYAKNGEATSGRVGVKMGELGFELMVVGDRTWTSSGPSAPRPFSKMPLRPEYAFGGPGYASNPVGKGSLGEQGQSLPNLERPDMLIRSPGDRPEPAFTTPIASGWAPRKDKLPKFSMEVDLDQWPGFPEGMDWSFYNASIAPLQCAYLRGDEAFRLDGVHPEHAVLEGRLPGQRPRAFIQTQAEPDRFTELRLNLDTVTFEPDDMLVTLVWRGAIETKDRFSSTFASLFVCDEPLDAPQPMAQIAERFEAEHRERYGYEPEVEAPAEEAPAFAMPPHGLSAKAAARLGLPAWMAARQASGQVATGQASTEASAAAPEKPSPALSRAEVEALSADTAMDLKGKDLTACDLSGLNFSGRDLSGALLAHANLDGADFRQANLSSADLGRVSAKQTRFDGATLDGADLSHADCTSGSFVAASLASTTFDRLVANAADFRQVKGEGPVFTWSLLEKARFDEAELAEANFSDARIDESSFYRAGLENAHFYTVVGSRVRFDEARMERFRADQAMLPYVTLRRALLQDATFKDAQLPKADFSEARLEKTTFIGTGLEDAVFDRTQLVEMIGDLANCERASFVGANLNKAHFEGANLRDGNFTGANLFDAIVHESDLRGTRFDGAHLVNAQIDRRIS